jgi:hypothetical protein
MGFGHTMAESSRIIAERRAREAQKPEDHWFDAGTSRTMSPYLKCAILVRDGIRCVYCRRRLTKEKHSLDHINGERNPAVSPKTNTEMNLVACCFDCNGARWRGKEKFNNYLLEERGVDPDEALARAKKAVKLPIDRRSKATQKLAYDWYGERIAYLNASGAARSAKSRAKRKEDETSITTVMARISLNEGTKADYKIALAAGYVDERKKITDKGQAALNATMLLAEDMQFGDD